MEFNQDGSLKLPEEEIKRRENKKQIFQDESAIKITRFQISSTTPLNCELTLHASNKLKEPEKIKQIFEKAKGKFKHMSELSILKIDDKEYKVKIISGRFRCSWCENFRNFLEEELDTKIINQGSCLFYSSSNYNKSLKLK